MPGVTLTDFPIARCRRISKQIMHTIPKNARMNPVTKNDADSASIAMITRRTVGWRSKNEAIFADDLPFVVLSII